MSSLKLLPSIRFYFSPERNLYSSIWQVLQYRPKNLGLFKLALTHKSASLKVFNTTDMNNERLEFLGDSILNTIVADLLYNYYPDKDEGFLTKMRSKIVSRETLNHIARQIGLDKLLFSELNGFAGKNVLGNALEAIIGALFIDAGFESTKRHLVDHMILPFVDFDYFEELTMDYKSQLIEWSQKNEIEVVFEEIEYEEQNHNPVFQSEVKIYDKVLGTGKGKSKKEAQQKAAKKAFDIYIES